MHENRETSETSAAQSGSRSAGEGIGHTARVHVCEESHRGIVPMNHSNKDARPSAESGEGRPLIKENAGQSSTCPTQSGKGVSQGLAGVRKAAREHKERKFTALLHHLNIDLLRESLYSLKRKAASCASIRRLLRPARALSASLRSVTSAITERAHCSPLMSINSADPSPVLI